MTFTRQEAGDGFADFKAFVQKVQVALPKTHIDFISIAPNPSR